jgi:DNA-binding HxlR family transcriptional regulator
MDLRSGCPIATTLDLIGDKWTLLLIRDMLVGKERYQEFLASPEGITTNILASRLKRMEERGLITKSLYQQHPPRFVYVLTDLGRSLHPVLQSICRWANTQIPDTWTPPESFMAEAP